MNQEIEKAFLLLEIPPTLDKSKIISAWKKKASQYHPDRAELKEQKEEYHIKFIQLLEAKDKCISFLKNSSTVDKDLHYESQNDTHSQSEKEVKLENEWENFVKNEKKYFSSKELIKLAIFSFFEISFHSILVSILSSLIVIICTILSLGLLSMMPELPIFIWIFLPISLLFLAFYTSLYFKYLDTLILKKLTQIGYPFKYYVILWILENILISLILLYDSKYYLFAFLIGNFGFVLQFHRIITTIHEIEDVLKSYSNNNDLV